MWKIQRTNALSVAPGVLVQANPERIAVYICNLGPSLCHLSSEPGDVGTAQGLPIAVGEKIPLYWEREGGLAQSILYVTDPPAAQGFFILECLWFPEPGGDNGPT